MLRQLKSIVLSLCITALYLPAANAQWHNDVWDSMGTRVSIELWHDNEVKANQAIDAVKRVMQQVNAQMSPYIRSSELYRINNKAATSPVTLSAELYRVIDKALYYSSISDGAFDISFSSLGKFYDYRQGVTPSEQQRARALPAINYQLIVLDKQQRTIFFKHPLLNIDLGGIAKGYAVDLAIEQLKILTIESAIVSAGGDSRILGDRRGTPWVVGIRHPRKKAKTVVRIPLENTAMSTSGDYERFFIKENERIHHIINPATGKSANEVQSVSILAPLAIDSDALSTTVFVLGIKKGLALVNKLPGIDAVIIDADGKMHYSQELLRPVKRQ